MQHHARSVNHVEKGRLFPRRKSRFRCGLNALSRYLVGANSLARCLNRVPHFGYHERMGQGPRRRAKPVQNFMNGREIPQGHTATLHCERVTGYNGVLGAWLSLVERLVRVQEAGGSNPLAPTNYL